MKKMGYSEHWETLWPLSVENNESDVDGFRPHTNVTSEACSRRFQNSPLGLKQMKLLVFHFAKIYWQKTF